MKVTAHVFRDGRFWGITIPEVPGALSQVRRLNEAEGMARSAVADLLQIDAASVEIVLDIEVPANELVLVTEAKRALAVADKAAKVASEANRRVVTELRRGGYTTREVAAVLGVTPGRVNQIENKAKAKATL